MAAAPARSLALIAVALGAGCGDGPRASCALGFIGDSSLPPEVELVVTDGASGLTRPLVDGDSVQLRPPPQGGFVFYVGARARNMDACDIGFTGDLREISTGRSVAYAARNVNLKPSPDGWGQSDATVITSFVHMNPCPNYEPEELVARPYRLDFEVRDRSERRKTVTVSIVPQCMLTDARQQMQCSCQCSAGFFPGKCSL